MTPEQQQLMTELRETRNRVREAMSDYWAAFNAAHDAGISYSVMFETEPE